MSNRTPLMPKATAVWLVQNTSLSFDQIAEFCGLHHLEVKGIADGDVAQGIRGLNPITNGQLSRDEIDKAEKRSEHKLQLGVTKVEVPVIKTKKGPRFVPVSRRHVRPNAVLWLLKNHPELKDAQIMRLIGTTKPTIATIRNRTHWDMQNLAPQDPVTLGICSQIDLDAEVAKASERAAKDGTSTVVPAGMTLQPTESMIPGTGPQPGFDIPTPELTKAELRSAEVEEEAAMMARLKQIGGGKKADADEEGDEPASG